MDEKWNNAEIRRWEEACRSAVERAFSESNVVGPEKTIKSVRLEGTYPATRLKVDYRNEFRSQDRTIGFELWGPLFETVAGTRDDPDTAATMIFANTIED